MIDLFESLIGLSRRFGTKRTQRNEIELKEFHSLNETKVFRQNKSTRNLKILQSTESNSRTGTLAVRDGEEERAEEDAKELEGNIFDEDDRYEFIELSVMLRGGAGTAKVADDERFGNAESDGEAGFPPADSPIDEPRP